jgi:hypothetical protein
MNNSADQLVLKAKKALKTGLFKWNKDYVKAAMCYDEAAKKYLAAKNYKRAIYVYEQLIPVMDKLRS